jgi:hypothetical protein
MAGWAAGVEGGVSGAPITPADDDVILIALGMRSLSSVECVKDTNPVEPAAVLERVMG